MGIRIKKTKHMWYVGAFLVMYVLVMLAMKIYSMTNVNYTDIYIWGVVINLCMVVSIFLIRSIEDNKFSLITIIVFICYMYNFGQILMWSFGIHSDSDIINSKLYGRYIANYESIFMAELYGLKCFMSMILGILFVIVLDFGYKKNIEENDKKEECIRKIIYKLSIYLGIVIIPATFIKVITILMQSANYGYLSIYYSNFKVGSLLSRAEDYFFPVLVGLLIGSNYKKVKLVYSIYAVFVILYMLAGERGNWIYSLFVLVWMHFNYYKKIDYKKLLKLSLVFAIVLYITGVIVDLRNIGISNVSSNEVYDMLMNNESFITRFIFEMGGTLGILVCVMDVGASAFVGYNNTFVSSMYASFSSRIAMALGVEYPSLALPDFFSRNILKITWGSGFNLFAECYINLQENGYLIMIFIGMIIAMFLKNSLKNNHSALRMYISCISAVSICAMFRDTSLTGFRMLVQFSLYLTLIVWFVYKIKYKK